MVTTRVLSTFAHEAAGAAGTRHSLRPLFWAAVSCTTPAHRAAGGMPGRHGPQAGPSSGHTFVKPLQKDASAARCAQGTAC